MYCDKGKDDEILSKLHNSKNTQPDWHGLNPIGMDQNKRSFKASARVPFTTFCSYLSSGLTCWVHSHAVKVSVTSTTKVSFSNDADAKTNNALPFGGKPHKGLFDSKSLSNNDFQLVVDSRLILHSEGEHTTKPNGLVNRDNLVYFDDHIGLVGPIQLVELIVCVGHTNNFVGPSQLIVESKYFNDSKISLHFCKDCGIFCEGD
jgi:hypothetical protein